MAIELQENGTFHAICDGCYATIALGTPHTGTATSKVRLLGWRRFAYFKVLKCYKWHCAECLSRDLRERDSAIKAG